ncbi:N-carbamoylputrescine amidase, partial [Salmonella enterica subsp. enterica serovar Enteritidis]|nr:N-carbamoylputrescine amidase [Salmonella enterica subsp. enterica serovar Enteritidis]
MRFYGSSFICDHKGAMLAEADRDNGGIWLHDLDLARMRDDRLSWGIYRDRRPEMYAPLQTLDGKHPHTLRA